MLVGFSDHSKGIDASVASIHYGTKMIEKHFTLNNKKSGYDHKVSLEPKEFSQMVKNIRKNEEMVGIPDYQMKDTKADFEKLKKIIRQFYLINDVKKNSFINQNDFKLIRAKSYQNFVPLHKIINKILKSKTNKNLKGGKFLRLNDFKR